MVTPILQKYVITTIFKYMVISCSGLFGYFSLDSLYQLLDSKLCLTLSIILYIKQEFPSIVHGYFSQ